MGRLTHFWRTAESLVPVTDARLDFLHPRRLPAPPPLDAVCVIQFACVQHHTWPVSFRAPPADRAFQQQCPDCGLPGHWVVIDLHMEHKS